MKMLRPASPLALPSTSIANCLDNPFDYHRFACPIYDPTRCPPKGVLTFNYGRCYLISDIDGNGLTKRWDSGWLWYHFGKYLQTKNIVLRICRIDVLSTCAGADEPISEKGTWYIFDQTGFLDGVKTDFVGSLGDSYEYSLIAIQPTQISHFRLISVLT